jgi:hypothetical protein
VNQKGITSLLILVTAGILVLILGDLYWRFQTSHRLPWDTELHDNMESSYIPDLHNVPTASSSAKDTVNWKTYTYDKIAFRYPSNWVAKPNGDSGLELYNPGLALGIWEHDNPSHLSLKAYSDKKHQEIIAGGYGAESPPLFSDKSVSVQLPNGNSAQYEKEFLCEPSICQRYVIEQPDVFYEIIVFQAMKADDLNQILSTFKFTDPNQQSGKESDWITSAFDKGTFEVSYPKTWKTDLAYQPVRFTSPDFKYGPGANVAQGFDVQFGVNALGYSPDASANAHKESVQWFNQPATLYTWTTPYISFMLLKGKIPNVQFGTGEYGALLTTKTQEVRDANKEVFLKVADSIRFKIPQN